jgi:bifunctional non-homologous end joining protein LigD
VIKSELLTEITEQQATMFVDNDNFGCEEKHNGERRTIVKNADGSISDFNREGERGKGFSSHPYLVNALKAHPLPTFQIDVEYEMGVLVILDVHFLGGLDFRTQEYSKRKEAAGIAFNGFNQHIKVCKTITGKAAKAAFVEEMRSKDAEGVVFKKLTAVWRPGRSEQHFKLKFWKSLDCVVMAPSPKGHNSVEVGVYNKQGKLHRICGVSLNGKPSVKIGDVLEIDYLYGTEKLEVVQPNLARVRSDKKPHQCTIDQIIVNKNFRRK